MRDYQPITKTVLGINTITCNNCGKVFSYYSYDIPIEEVIIYFGFGSRYDMEAWKFDLCDDCVEQITKNFKIPPEIINHI